MYFCLEKFEWKSDFSRREREFFLSISCFETRTRNRNSFLEVEREKMKLILTGIPGNGNSRHSLYWLYDDSLLTYSNCFWFLLTFLDFYWLLMTSNDSLLTPSLFLLTSTDSVLTSMALLWLSNDSLLTSTDSLLTLYWHSADFYSSSGWPGWPDLPKGSYCIEFESTACWEMLAHLRICSQGWGLVSLSFWRPSRRS